MSKESAGYTLKLTGPGHTFEKPVSEDVANKIINLVMTGTSAALGNVQANPATLIAQSNVAGAAASKDLTPKQFLAIKKPGSNYERVACLAYYLSNYRQEPTFKTADITKLNTEAAQPKLSNPALFVKDTTSKYGYLSSAGGGRKQITTLGEAVVEALPEREKVALAWLRTGRLGNGVVNNEKGRNRVDVAGNPGGIEAPFRR